MEASQRADMFAKLEQVGKLTAVAAVVVYATGYLIVGIYEGSKGFFNPSALRPRILSAGVLFIVVCALATMGALLSYRRLDGFAGKYRLKVWVVVLAQYSCICAFLALSIGSEMTDFSKDANIALYFIGFIPAMVMVVTALVTVRPNGSDKAHNMGIVFLLAILLITPLVVTFRSHDRSGVGFFAFLLIIGFVSMFLMSPARSTELASNFYGPTTIIQVFVVVAIFAKYIYPHVNAEWGGGRPISVTITYSKDAQYLAGKVSPALLQDESDTGYFLVDANTHHSYFVPRSAVSLLDFQQPGDPHPQKIAESYPF